jgi:hypothetical protein
MIHGGGINKTAPYYFKENAMEFFSDHYFQIGHTHVISGKPCQDHALSKTSGNIACAIVSDGCSTGSNTDVGSRILTFATLQAIREHAIASNGSLETAESSINTRQKRTIEATRLILGLGYLDMLATCLYAYLTQNGGLIHVQGDGVIVLKYRDGTSHLIRYDWADNAPFYPSYEGADLKSFIEKHGNNLDGIRCESRTIIREAGGTCTELEPQKFTLQRGLNGFSIAITRDELELLDLIAIFTDGVTQIEETDWKDAATGFLAFKTTTGEFAKRRMIRGIKDFQQNNRQPLDDISYAVILVNHGGETKEAV